MSIRSSSPGTVSGATRRLTKASRSKQDRLQVVQADCLAALAELPANSVDAVITDPPYGIGFKGHAWDQPHKIGKATGVVSEHGRVHERKRQSAAHVAGEYDHALTAHEQFEVFVRDWARECLRVLKPGGHLVSFGSPRTAHRLVSGVEEAGFEIRDLLLWLFGTGFPKSRNLTGAWKGWGTTLKPAYEPIVLARKPLAESTQRNAETHGTGALHIDACRLPADQQTDRGRWPTSVLLGHSPDCEDEKCASDCPIGALDLCERVGMSPARFFYCTKASRSEREAGCEKLARHAIETLQIGAEREARARAAKVGNVHPTVKPIALMQWLIRLIAPPSGLVLDPFAGSGSTGCAAALEQRRFLGIERDEGYVEIARARIAHWASIEAKEGA